MKQNKIGILILYFGKFPNYFQLFLNSCRTNKDYDFLFFTDNDINLTNEDTNIKVYKMQFEDLKKIFEERLKTKIDIFFPYKLCDYKPTYGFIFEDYLKQYEYWGHCDIDLIFGNISKFLIWDEIKKYDKIQRWGHLTLYRNNKNINTLFKEENGNYIYFKTAMHIKDACLFDEQSINTIFQNNNIDIYENKKYYDCIRRFPYLKSNNFEYRKGQVIVWKKGELYQLYPDTNEKNEILYIHLQKRKFEHYKVNNENNFYITCNGFFDVTSNIKEISKPNIRHVYNFYANKFKKVTINIIKRNLILKGIISADFLNKS